MSEQKDSSFPADRSDVFLSAMKDGPERGQYPGLVKGVIVLAIASYVKFALAAVDMAAVPTVVIMILVTIGAYALVTKISKIVSSVYRRKSPQSS